MIGIISCRKTFFHIFHYFFVFINFLGKAGKSFYTKNESLYTMTNNGHKMTPGRNMNSLHKATSMGALQTANDSNRYYFSNEGGFSDGETGLMTAGTSSFALGQRPVRGYASDDHLSRYCKVQRRTSSRLSQRIESFLYEVSVQEQELMQKQINQLRRYGTSRKSPSVASINSKLMTRTATSSSATIKAPSQKSVSNISLSSTRQFSRVGRKSASVPSHQGSGKEKSFLFIYYIINNIEFHLEFQCQCLLLCNLFSTALGSRRRTSKTSTTPTISINSQPPVNHKTSFVQHHSSLKPNDKLTKNAFDRSRRRPNTAPAVKQNSSSIYNKKLFSEGNPNVPNTNKMYNSQHRQQRPTSSINVRTPSNKGRKTHSADMERPSSVANTNIASKLRQDRNYQPPRRRPRRYNSAERSIDSRGKTFCYFKHLTSF